MNKELFIVENLKNDKSRKAQNPPSPPTPGPRISTLRIVKVDVWVYFLCVSLYAVGLNLDVQSGNLLVLCH